VTVKPNAKAGPEVRFVLVGPQTAGNVGAAARALKNLGFERLVVVAPECDIASTEARRMAVDAADLLERAAVAGTLDEALAGAGTAVGTSRRVGKYRKPHYRLELFSQELAGLAQAGELAVVFGREDSGLTDQELDRCTHLVCLPAAEAYPSFNLAQSVLLVAYELRRVEVMERAEPPQVVPASHESREAMYRHVERALRAIGFLAPETSETMMRRLRRLYGRAGVTDEEVQILRGVAHQTLWAARQAGLESDDA
jgi:TrmH family RNA methyltransferase